MVYSELQEWCRSSHRTPVSFVLVSEQYPKRRSIREMSSQRSDWRERLLVNPSQMEQELALRLQENRVDFRTQVEIPVTIADLYFPTEPPPLLAFVDGPVHHGKAQIIKDKETRSGLRKKVYRVLELRGVGSYSFARLSPIMS